MVKMIICKGCGKEKPYYAKNMCKQCYNHEYSRKWAKDNPEKLKARKRRWYKKYKRELRDAKLRKLYGVSLEEYEEMLKIQNNVCAICGKPPRKGKRSLSVDHDHKTGKVRGLLCNNCNLGLGKFQDNSHITDRATDYLLKYA